MLIRRPSDIAPSEITDRTVYRQRRRLLLGAGALLGLGAAGTLLGLDGGGATVPAAPSREKIFAGLPRGVGSSDGLPSDYRDATGYNNFDELGRGKGGPGDNAHHLQTEAPADQGLHLPVR